MIVSMHVQAGVVGSGCGWGLCVRVSTGMYGQNS